MAEHDIEKLTEIVIEDGNCQGKNYNFDHSSPKPFKIQISKIRNASQNHFYGDSHAPFSSCSKRRSKYDKKQRQSSRCYHQVFKFQTSRNKVAQNTDENQAATIRSFSLIFS